MIVHITASKTDPDAEGHVVVEASIDTAKGETVGDAVESVNKAIADTKVK